MDIYVMPAVVGGGRGDVEEVLLAGRQLARDGRRVLLYRSRPLPIPNASTFELGGIRRVDRLAPRSPRAVTISPQFGVTAADGRDEPLGRPGPWAIERAEIDRPYGPDRVVHVSLEEFARARPSAELAEERWRESGVSSRTRGAARGGRTARRERDEFRRLFRKFRALDRPDVLPVFPTFVPSRTFAREFPETVQSGPLWPEPIPPRTRRPPAPEVRVLWYASPSTSDRLLPRLLAGLSASGAPIALRVRSGRPIVLPRLPGVRGEVDRPRSPAAWRRTWAHTDRAIVTGTRTLLEALVVGVPFLYFNGVLGRGRAARRHRPEKIRSLLAALRSSPGSVVVRRDLADFSRLRRVEPIVARWVRAPARIDPGFRRTVGRRFPRGFEDASALLADVVDRFAPGDEGAAALVRSVRRASRRRRSKV